MKVLLILLALAIAVVNSKTVPDYFPQCKKTDPEIEKCLVAAIEAMKPKLKTGIPEVNVPALDPFIMPTLKVDRTAANLRLKAVIKNIKAYGGSDFKIEKLRLNLDNKYLAELKLTIPKLRVSADYDVLGSRILTVDVNGKGRLKGNFTGITVVAKGAGKPLVKEGIEYLHADKIVTKLRINYGQISLDDDERPVAATSAAAFFNSSPGTILEILNPLIEETISAVLKAFVNKILEIIPLNELLLE